MYVVKSLRVLYTQTVSSLKTGINTIQYKLGFFLSYNTGSIGAR
jgi:hypothetical protein